MKKSPVFFSASLDNLGLILNLLSSVSLLLLFLQSFLLGSDCLNVSCNEQVNHLVPWLVHWDLASQSHHLSGQHPEYCGNGLWHSVVAWNYQIDKVQWSVSVAQSNRGNVNVWSFNDGLSVALWVSNNQKSWLLEFFCQLVGQSTGNPSWWWAGSCSGVLTELVDGSLTVLLSADNDDFSKVRNWGNESCGELDFSVSFINSENVVTGWVLFFDELFHVVIDLVSAEVNLQ